MALIVKVHGGLSKDEQLLILEISSILKIGEARSADIVGHLIDHARNSNKDGLKICGMAVDRNTATLDFHYADEKGGNESVLIMTFKDSNFAEFTGMTQGAKGALANFYYAPYIPLSIVRKIMPNIIAQEIVGVQPMDAPTGLIFTLGKNKP